MFNQRDMARVNIPGFVFVRYVKRRLQLSFWDYLLLDKGRVLHKQVLGKSLVLEILEETNAINMSLGDVIDRNLVPRTQNRSGS